MDKSLKDDLQPATSGPVCILAAPQRQVWSVWKKASLKRFFENHVQPVPLNDKVLKQNEVGQKLPVKATSLRMLRLVRSTVRTCNNCQFYWSEQFNIHLQDLKLILLRLMLIPQILTSPLWPGNGGSLAGLREVHRKSGCSFCSPQSHT